MHYQPRNFSDLFETPLGGRLWDYLQRPAVIFAMEVATKLHRPAVEAIGDDLIREFGDSIRERRIKQLIGHMIRQLLESRGFELDAQRVPVRFDDLCSTGSRYRRAHGRQEAPLDMNEPEPHPEKPQPHLETPTPVTPRRPPPPIDKSNRPQPRPAVPVSLESETTAPGGGWAAWGGPE